MHAQPVRWFERRSNRSMRRGSAEFRQIGSREAEWSERSSTRAEELRGPARRCDAQTVLSSECFSPRKLTPSPPGMFLTIGGSVSFDNCQVLQPTLFFVSHPAARETRGRAPVKKKLCTVIFASTQEFALVRQMNRSDGRNRARPSMRIEEVAAIRSLNFFPFEFIAEV